MIPRHCSLSLSRIAILFRYKMAKTFSRFGNYKAQTNNHMSQPNNSIVMVLLSTLAPIFNPICLSQLFEFGSHRYKLYPLSLSLNCRTTSITLQRDATIHTALKLNYHIYFIFTIILDKVFGYVIITTSTTRKTHYARVKHHKKT